jgi:hypothetical protein
MGKQANKTYLHKDEQTSKWRDEFALTFEIIDTNAHQHFP